jgi:hypothetical protein
MQKVILFSIFDQIPEQRKDPGCSFPFGCRFLLISIMKVEHLSGIEELVSLSIQDCVDNVGVIPMREIVFPLDDGTAKTALIARRKNMQDPYWIYAIIV